MKRHAIHSNKMLTIVLVFLFASFSLSYSSCGRSVRSPILSNIRIIGGRTAREHSWPWIVSIHRTNMPRSWRDSGVAFCGGTLIKEKYVLTAAHCFYNVNHSFLSKYFVVMGAHYINESNPIRFPIKSVRIHENYDDNLYLNDIALIELACKANLKNPNIGLICLPPKNISIYPYEEVISTVAGWGSLVENGSMSHTLQQTQLPIISNKDELCIRQISENFTQFCAGFTDGGSDACQGDSGGPLMICDDFNHTWYLAGITSYGYGCGRVEYPGVYTRVSVFMDWIEKHTNSSTRRQSSMTIACSLLLLYVIRLFYWE